MGRRGDARRLLHHPDLARGARTPTHDRPAEGLRHREVLVLRGASRPFGGAGSHALSARIGAHADGRGSRGTVSAAAHRPPAGRIPISPPAGAPEPDRSLLRHRHAPAGGLPVAGSRRDSVARIIRMGGHRAVLLRRRALCRSGGSEGGAPQARGAEAPADQPPQPLRQLSSAQQLPDLAPQRRQHDARHVERRPRRPVHRRPPRDAAADVHAAATPGAVRRAGGVRHPAGA